MSEWKRAGSDKSKYLKFEVGKIFVGIYNGFKERENPFYDPNKVDSNKVITDYLIDIEGEEKVLSSTARTLADQLKSLPAPLEVKIECVQKGIRKWYSVWTNS